MIPNVVGQKTTQKTTTPGFNVLPPPVSHASSVPQSTSTCAVHVRPVRNKGAALVIPVTVEGVQTLAVVDTAAETTIISRELFMTLPEMSAKWLQNCEEVTLGNAEKQSSMTGYLVPDVSLGIGKQTYTWDVIVAPITDNMLLGADFLYSRNAILHLGDHRIELDGQVIFAFQLKAPNGKLVKVCRVMVAQQTTVPPHSVKHVSVKLSSTDRSLYALEASNNHGLLLGAGVIEGGSPAVVSFINDTDHHLKLPADHICGLAMEIEQLLEDSDDPSDTSLVDAIRTRTVTVVPDCKDPESGSHTVNLTPVSKETLQQYSFPELEKALPEHMKGVWQRAKVNLESGQLHEVLMLLIIYEDVFARHDFDLGEFEELQHEIHLNDLKPFKERMRRTPLCFQQEEEKTLQHMLKAGVIQPSTSEWASAPVLVRKKDGSLRYCIDYRPLNSRTIRDCFPLSLIEDCLDTLNGTHYFSSVDMASGYWQISIRPEDRPKTAFVTRYGLYEHVRMGFGLCNAPATFSRAMGLVLRGLTYRQVLAYLDDVVIVGRTFEEHIGNLEVVLARFRSHNLKLKPKKCHLFQKEIDFLGRRVSSEGIRVQEQKVETIRSWPQPKTKSKLASFLGTVNYHRDFIPRYADIASPLYELMKPKVEYLWGDKHTTAYEELKRLMCETPVLSYPNAQDLFVLDCDASQLAIGSELLQIQNGRERAIAFSSYILTPAQRRYCTTRKELLALITFTRHFRVYLLGRPFIVRTDHASLTWLMSFRRLEGQLARWNEELSQYDMKILHRPGKKHQNADGVSRIPLEEDLCDCYVAGKDLSSLPCGGCPYCTRCHRQWARFEEDVDDVIPIVVRRIATELADPNENQEELQPELTVLQGYSFKQLREEQLKDPEVQVVINWMESDPPSQATLFRQGKVTKRLWACRSQLKICQGVLFYRWEYLTYTRLKLIVPQGLKDEVLRLHHDIPSGGHYGYDKTLAKVRESCYWYGITVDVDNYVKVCDVCARSKKRPRSFRRELGDYQSGSRLERVHLDLLGPFLESSRTSSKFVLMIVCQFTKFVLCLPLADQSAEALSRVFFEQFVCLFGCPLEIHTDQGRNFDSNYFKALCSLLDIAKTRTTPYRPSSNGQVETYNRVVLRFLRSYLEGKQRDWDQHLPVLGMSLRASVNRHTGYTPNYLMFGTEINMPADIMLGTATVNKTDRPVPEHVKQMQESLRLACQAVRVNLGVAQRRQKKEYDAKAYQRTYNRGDLVYKLDESTKIGESKKLRPVYTGPFLITEVISPSLYRVSNQKKSFVLHHDKLLICRSPTIPFWLRKKRNQLFADLETQSDESLEQLPIQDEDLLTQESPEVNLDLSNLFTDEMDTEVDTSGGSDADTSILVDNEQLPPVQDAELITAPARPTRSGRSVRPPSYLQDYQQ